MENILLLAFTEPDGGFHKTALEALGAAQQLSRELGASLTIGLIGGDVQPAANVVANGAAGFLPSPGPTLRSRVMRPMPRPPKRSAVPPIRHWCWRPRTRAPAALFPGWRFV